MSIYHNYQTETLEEIDLHLTSSTCCLSNSVKTDLQQIVNGSLLSGTFPKSLNTAAIKPLLKKKTLDASKLNNLLPDPPFIAQTIEKVHFSYLSNFLNSSGHVDASDMTYMIQVKDQFCYY